jgi:TolB-like protein
MRILFGEKYDGKWEDIFSIQDAIAMRVAEKVKAVLTSLRLMKADC